MNNPPDNAQTEAALRAENERLRDDHSHACGLIADMHHAATGTRDGPRIGVVEDVAAVAADLECERMRLVACSVVANADTPESAAKAREMHPDYRSAACDDVARRVDECIALRKENDHLRAALELACETLSAYMNLPIEANAAWIEQEKDDLAIMDKVRAALGLKPWLESMGIELKAKD